MAKSIDKMNKTELAKRVANKLSKEDLQALAEIVSAKNFDPNRLQTVLRGGSVVSGVSSTPPYPMGGGAITSSGSPPAGPSQGVGQLGTTDQPLAS